jgi:putative methionine-R-sulfoxide reductase with GAF domain
MSDPTRASDPRPRPDHGAYVRKVQEDTQTFAHGLMGEVERLKVLVAALEEERERHRREEAALQAQIEGIRHETEAYTSRYAAVEQQNSNLANLYVASYRLHGTLDRKEVVAAVQEIIANLVGSEEAALYELDSETQTLHVVESFGLDREQCPPVALGTGLIGLAARTGEILVVDPGQPSGATGVESRLTACVPLKLDDKVTGVIAVFSLLPQKGGIEDLDRELFDLLATQAAFALYCTALHAKVALEVARRW